MMMMMMTTSDTPRSPRDYSLLQKGYLSYSVAEDDAIPVYNWHWLCCYYHNADEITEILCCILKKLQRGYLVLVVCFASDAELLLAVAQSTQRYYL